MDWQGITTAPSIPNEQQPVVLVSGVWRFHTGRGRARARDQAVAPAWDTERARRLSCRQHPIPRSHGANSMVDGRRLEMESRHTPIAVDQCLFGYDRGHRMITTSCELSPAASSLLLVLSDLAPGVTLGPRDSYWTGVPLPDVRRFALLKTWPAFEMPRPGCVWTHALVVTFADLARIS